MSETTIRLSIFAIILLGVALCENFFPRRARHKQRLRRWRTHFLIVMLDTALLRLVFPLAAVGVGLYAQSEQIGLFNWIEFPFWLAFLVSFIILDLSTYAAHVASHYWPFLWRFHKVHHADIDLDVSSGFRFHPVEILLSMGWKSIVILILGAPAIAVLLFEIVLSSAAMFNHANLNIKGKIDRILRYFIVTPDMHRIHHSIIEHETNSNFGFNLSLWDYLFKTMLKEPEKGQEKMILGLEEHQNDNPTRFFWSLKLPFMKKLLKKNSQSF